MRPNREAGNEEVRHQSLIYRHAQERRRQVNFKFVRNVFKQRSNALSGTLRPPQSCATVMLFACPVEGTSIRKRVSSVLRIEGTRRLRSYSEVNGPSLILASAMASHLLPQFLTYRRPIRRANGSLYLPRSARSLVPACSSIRSAARRWAESSGRAAWRHG